MTRNLRRSLTVFEVGFLVESLSGFVALAGATTGLPFHGWLVVASPAFSLVGISFLWVGRHEWNGLHRTRVGHAAIAFGLSILAVALAAVPVAYLALSGDRTPPDWLSIEFGAAIAAVFAGTFVTYALVASHLVGRTGRVALVLGLGWSVAISAAIGVALAPQLRPLTHSVLARSVAVAQTLQPITLLDALLAFGYLAFFVAFADAHWRVARGLDPSA